MSSGSTASARAIAARLRMPPDSSPGSWSPGATRRSTPASTTCSPYAFRTPASSTGTAFARSAATTAILGGCWGNHGGCGERSGGCERRARSSLLRRAFRHASSVVAALAALAPRLLRLAHHDYPNRLLIEREGDAHDQEVEDHDQ